MFKPTKLTSFGTGLILIVVAFLLSMIVGSCSEMQSEADRWKSDNAPQGNRYAAAVAVRNLSEVEKKEAIEDFWTYLDARQAIQSGLPSSKDHALVIQTRLNDLEQRITVLRFLLKDLSAVSSPDVGEMARRQNLEQEIVRLSLSSARLRLLLSTAREEQGRKTYRVMKICLVDSYGVVSCSLERQLLETNLFGYWDESRTWKTVWYDEPRAYMFAEFLNEIDDRFSEKMFDTKVGCANEFWFGVNTGGSGGDQANSSTGTDTSLSAFPTTAELLGMVSACRAEGAIVRAPSSGAGSRSGGGIVGSGGGLGGGSSDWVQDTIDEMDAEVDRLCSLGGVGGGVAKINPGHREYMDRMNFNYKVATQRAAQFGTYPSEGGSATSRVGQIPDNQLSLMAEMLGEIANEAYDATVEAVDAHYAADQAQAEADDAQQRANNLNSEADAAEIEAQDAQTAANANPEDAGLAAEAARKREAADAKKKAAAEAQAEADKKKAEAKKKKEEAAKKKKAAEQNTMPSGESSACGAGWAQFKAECERTDSWERVGSGCNEFIRRRNNCVSSSLINPTPDGDNTCMRGKFTSQEIQARACEERQKIMSVAENLGSACRFWEPINISLSDLTDICNDPRAMPGPDTQCHDFGITPPDALGQDGNGIDGGQPKPVLLSRNAIQFGNVLIFDGLLLEGLGLGAQDFNLGAPPSGQEENGDTIPQ